jgi:hypothetical protein
MTEQSADVGKKTSRKKIFQLIVVSILSLIIVLSIFIYINFNKILSDLVYNSFNSNIISDVYELKFNNLRFNILKGNIKVMDVELKLREVPLKKYPYINSSLNLKAGTIILGEIELIQILKSKKLELKKIEILNPEIELFMGGEKIEFFPYSNNSNKEEEKIRKKKIGSYYLSRFDLINANIHSINTFKQREFKLDSINISMNELNLKQATIGVTLIFKKAELRLEKFTSQLKKDKIRNFDFSKFQIQFNDVELTKSTDTLLYKMRDYRLELKGLDICTADSIVQIGLESLDLSKSKEYASLKGFSFKPDMDKATKLEKYKYQTPPLFSIVAGDISFNGFKLDSLTYGKKLYVDEIIAEDAFVSIFKDKLKPLNKMHFPLYPGQKVQQLKLPVLVKLIKAKNLNINNKERKPDGAFAEVKIMNIVAEIKNYTNILSDGVLAMDGSGSIENTADFSIQLEFSYKLPQFTFKGNIKRFDLIGLNPLLKAYSPVKINKGIIDNITFSGIAMNTKSNGTMAFLYHDLDIDLKLKGQADWKNSFLAFAANTYVNNSNPVSSDKPAKVVHFEAARDMHKGFLNIVLTSFFAGIKQTLISSGKEKADKKDKESKSSQ